MVFHDGGTGLGAPDHGKAPRRSRRAQPGLALLIVAVVAAVWPRVVAWPFALLLVWLGGALLARAARLRRERPR